MIHIGEKVRFRDAGLFGRSHGFVQPLLGSQFLSYVACRTAVALEHPRCVEYGSTADGDVMAVALFVLASKDNVPKNLTLAKRGDVISPHIRLQRRIDIDVPVGLLNPAGA